MNRTQADFLKRNLDWLVGQTRLQEGKPRQGDMTAAEVLTGFVIRYWPELRTLLETQSRMGGDDGGSDTRLAERLERMSGV